jgi:hypothetical protein
VNALKDRKIDAFFWVGGLPTAAVTDLANSPGVKIKMIDIAHLVPVMAKKHGNIYIKDVIPQRTYKGMEADNQAATVTNLMTVHQNMDEKTAYVITKTLFENVVDLVRVHAEAVNIKLENQKDRGFLDPLASRARSSTWRSAASRSSDVCGHPGPVQPAGGAFDFGESMSEDATLLHKPAAEVSAEALQRAEEMIERVEGVQNKHKGWIAAFVMAVSGCDVPVPLVHRLRDRAARAPARDPPRLRAVPVVPDLPRRQALPPPRHVVGLAARARRASRPPST